MLEVIPIDLLNVGDLILIEHYSPNTLIIVTIVEVDLNSNSLLFEEISLDYTPEDPDKIIKLTPPHGELPVTLIQPQK